MTSSPISRPRSVLALRAERAAADARLLLGLLLLGLLLLGAPLDVAFGITPLVRNLLVTDRTADPLGLGGEPGGVFVLRLESSNPVRIGSFVREFVDPQTVLPLSDRSFLVVDSGADPFFLGQPVGAIWEVDPRPGLNAQVAELVAGSALFFEPLDALIEPEGTILVVDAEANPNRALGRPGAIFRIDRETRSAEVVAASTAFIQPRSLIWDRDGSVLVLDSAANPLRIPDATGAIFRLNRETGVVTLFRALRRPLLSPSAIALLPDGDILVSDRNADPLGRGGAPGAIFRVPRDGGPTTHAFSDPQFVDPNDLIVAVDGEVWVLDNGANPLGQGDARGALFSFDPDSGVRTRVITSSLFRTLTGLSQVVGAEVDSSRVSWTDEDQGLLRPGNFLTVRAVVRNTGTAVGRGITLADSLGAFWTYVAGSDSASLGQMTYRPETRTVGWSGTLGVGEEVALRFRIRLDEASPAGTMIQSLVLSVDEAETVYNFRGVVRRGLEVGTLLFTDYLNIENEQVGVIHEIVADTLAPRILHAGAPLGRPSDLVFLEDDRLAILDVRAFPDRLGGPEAVFIYDASTSRFDTLLARFEGDGLVSPQGITLDLDGSLLLIDKDANPLGCAEGAPGAIFRVALETGELTLVAANCELQEPLDAVVDRRGRIVVADFRGAQQGRLWEFDRSLGRWTEFPPPENQNWFVDPLGLALDISDRICVADLTGNPRQFAGDHGSVFFVRRSPVAYQLVASEERMVDPNDCFVDAGGEVYFTDRNADPLGLGGGDPGAVFALNPQTSEVRLVTASALLHRPDGITGLLAPVLTGTRAVYIDTNGGTPEPGDTLDLRLTVFNRSPRAAPQMLVSADFVESLQPIDGTASEGEVRVDLAASRASWSGRFAGHDTLIVIFRAVIAADASYGAEARTNLRVEGAGPDLNLSATLPVRAPFSPGNIVVSDASSDPRSLGGSPGAIFRLQDLGEPVRLVTSVRTLVGPSALEWSETGELHIAAHMAGDLGLIARLETATGVLTPLVQIDPRLKSPSDLLLTPRSGLLIVDPDAEGVTPESTGRVFRLPLGTSTLLPFAQDARFRKLSQLAFDGRGRLFLADRDADPGALGGSNPAAIFELDPTSGDVIGVFQDSALVEPMGLTALGDSTLLITDQAADPLGLNRPTGALFTYDPSNASIDLLLASAGLAAPRRTLVLPSGRMLVVDGEAQRPGLPGGHGVVFEFDPAQRSLRYYAFSDSFRALTDIAYLPSSFVQFDRYEVTDLTARPLYPADRIRVDVTLSNGGSEDAIGIAFVDTLPAQGDLVAESVNVTRGFVSVEGNVLTWVGDLRPGQTVELSYELQLQPFRSSGKVLAFRGVVRDEVSGELRRAVRLPVQVPLESGFYYVADGDADPYGLGSSPGAVLRVDQVSGVTLPFFSGPQLREPRDVALVGTLRPTVLILDSEARPRRGTGALYGLDPSTQTLTLIATDSTWLDPNRLLVISDDEVYVLDTVADPFRLTPGPGPGAIYHVDLRTGVVEAVFSDTTLVTPTAMAALPDGRIAVADANADPGGFRDRNGAIFAVDPIGGTISVYAVSPVFRHPIGLVRRLDGVLIVIDRDADPTGLAAGVGAAFAVDPAGNVVLLSASPSFRSLSGVTLGPTANPVVSDLTADPFGLGGTFGALHEWNPRAAALFSPLASTTLFASPGGLFLFRDLTPVESVVVEAAGTPDGVELRIVGPGEAPGARFLIYRTDLTGPDDTGPEFPEGYALVSGDQELPAPGPVTWLDREVEIAGWYRYVVAWVTDDGAVRASAGVTAQATGGGVRLALSPPAPNPSNGMLALRFSLPTPSDVRLTLYDVQGRRVRALVDRRLPAGYHVFIWDGRNGAGRTAAAGVYFARLETSHGARAQRIVRLD